MDENELLSDVDIRILCKMFNINLIDVCFKSKLNNMIIQNGSYVINMDKDDIGGTHWISFYVNGKRAVYYDSFGEEAPTEILNFCKRSGVKLIMNSFQVQHIDDIECGWWCISFLHWMEKHKTVNGFNLNMFNKQFSFTKLKENKKILQNYIRSIVNNTNIIQGSGLDENLIEISKVPKSNEIWKWSNPEKVRIIANNYLGKNIPVYLSNKSKKKYMVKNPNNKWIHFGQLNYSDFTHHNNLIRRDNYLKRSKNINGNWKNDKYSANNLSRNLLW